MKIKKFVKKITPKFLLNKIAKTYRKIEKKYSGKISYAQCGEDLIINFIFDQLGKKNISYLDLGANHPIWINNTYFFYKKGNTGVNVEPDGDLFKKIKRVRKKDICLNIGVGTKKEKMDFYLMSSSSLNTFSKKEAEALTLNNKQKIKKIVQIELLSVNQIISEYFVNSFPNFISIDIEGLDYSILKSFDFTKYKPEVFCVETLTYTEDNTEGKLTNIIELMKENGYFVYADTYINTIFVDKKSWENK